MQDNKTIPNGTAPNQPIQGQPTSGQSTSNQAAPVFSAANAPVFSAANATPQSVNSQPFGKQSVVTSNSESQPIVSKKLSLMKEQILIFICVGLGVLALIFIVATIFLATNKQPSTDTSSASGPVVSVSALGFSADRISNATSGATYRLNLADKDSSGNSVLSVRAGSASTPATVTIEVNWEFVNSYYNINVARNDNETFTLELNANVIDLAFGHPTNLSSDTVLLMLLDDGSVAYMPLAKALQSRNIKGYGKLDDIDNVVKFYQADVTESYETSATTLAQRDDGEIIDLRSRLLAIIGKDSQ